MYSTSGWRNHFSPWHVRLCDPYSEGLQQGLRTCQWVADSAAAGDGGGGGQDRGRGIRGLKHFSRSVWKLPAKSLLIIFSCNLKKPKFGKCTHYLHKLSSLIFLNVKEMFKCLIQLKLSTISQFQKTFQSLTGHFMHGLRTSAV